MEVFTQLTEASPLVGVLVLIIYQLIRDRKQQEGIRAGPSRDISRDTILQQTTRMHELMSAKDEDGVLLMYNRASHTRLMEALASTLTGLQTTLRDINHTQELQTKLLQELLEKR